MSRSESVFFLLGANHTSAPMALRELLYISEEPLAALLPQIKERYNFHELVALSTCNRFELLGIAPPTQNLNALLYAAFFELHHHHGDMRSKVSDEDVQKSLYLHTEADAVRHLYRVASSLDSLVLGETQITGQFKDAIALATRIGTIGPTLRRLGQDALATAKKVRTQTAIGKKTVSISHAALELASKIFGDLSDHSFLLIGAGEMSRVAAKYITNYKPKNIFIANRTIDRARSLVNELNIGEAFGLEELPGLLTSADIVISSTAAPGLILDATTVKRAQSARRGRPQILLDIAMPRDIDPACGKLDDVYLFDIDDLQQVAAANYEERRKAAEEAEQLIQRGVDQFKSWQRTWTVKPALAAFRNYLDELAGRELSKTLSKEHFRDLAPKQRESLDALVTAIVSKIAADAARHVTNPSAGFDAEQLAESLTALFSDEVELRKDPA